MKQRAIAATEKKKARKEENIIGKRDEGGGLLRPPPPVGYTATSPLKETRFDSLMLNTSVGVLFSLRAEGTRKDSNSSFLTSMPFTKNLLVDF